MSVRAAGLCLLAVLALAGAAAAAPVQAPSVEPGISGPVKGTYGRDTSCVATSGQADGGCAFGSGVANMARAGFNTVQADAEPGSLHAIAAQHLAAIVWVGDWLKSECRFEVSDTRLTSEIRSIEADATAHRAVLAYYLGDEPYLSLCPSAPRAFAQRTALIHSLDPGSRTFTVIQQDEGSRLTGAGYYHSWLGTVDLTGFDIYPCSFEKGCQWSELDRHASDIETAGFGDAQHPYLAVVQDFQDDHYRLPSVQELRVQAQHWSQHAVHASGVLVFSWNYRGLQLDHVPGNVQELQYDNAVYFSGAHPTAAAPQPATVRPTHSAGASPPLTATGKWALGLLGALLVGVLVVALLLVRWRKARPAPPPTARR